MLWLMLAALCELFGCYAVWRWARDHQPAWWLVVAVLLLLTFAMALTRAPAAFAGRAFAAYAGVYLLGALAWFTLVDRAKPDRWDLLGVTLGLVGALVILYAPRHR
jgi:small multidrug resistance family-3 protein